MKRILSAFFFFRKTNGAGGSLLRLPPTLAIKKKRRHEDFSIASTCIIRIFFSVFCMTVVVLPCWREIWGCHKRQTVFDVCVRPVFVLLLYLRMAGQTCLLLTCDAILVKSVRKNSLHLGTICNIVTVPLMVALSTQMSTPNTEYQVPLILLATVFSVELFRLKSCTSTIIILAPMMFSILIASELVSTSLAAILFFCQISSALTMLHPNPVMRHMMLTLSHVVEEVSLSSMVARVASDHCSTHYGRMQWTLDESEHMDA